MHLITGDETGLVRLISTDKKEFVTYGGPQSRALSVLSMQWLVSDEKFALLRVNGGIETYQINLEGPEGGVLELIGSFTSTLESPLKITRLDDKSVLCSNGKGEVDVVSLSAKSSFLDKSVNLFSGDNCLRGPVGSLVYNSSSSRLACGGQKNDLQVWDVVTKSLVWKAKNVPHDEVRLEVPVWITSIAFMPSVASAGTTTSASDCAGNIIATGTAHKHIRMYDTRMQRQPCQSWGVGDFRVTSVVPSYQNEQHLYVADCAGGVWMYDLRNGRRIRTLNGFDGSVRDLAQNANGGTHMAAVSLDRYVKVYDCRNQKNIFQAYLKNRLNCALMLGDVGSTDSDDDDADSFDSAEDNGSDGDLVEDFVDSEDDDDDDDEDDDEEDGATSYEDVDPSRKQKKSSSSKNLSNKKQKKR